MKKSTQRSLPGIPESPVTLTELRLVAAKIQTDTGRLTATLEGTVTSSGDAPTLDLIRLDKQVWATALMSWALQIQSGEVELMQGES